MTKLAPFLKTSTPRYATPRNPKNKTLGAEVAAVAKGLGAELMPWQRQVADVALEMIVDPATGLDVPRFREIVVTVPRQSGKTLFTLAYELQRALRWGSPQTIAYTAQTGWDARKKLIDDQVPLIMAGPLKAALDRVYRGAGMESVRFTNGSRIDVLANTATAGHGRIIDLGIIDEAMADTDHRREQALIPAMATRRTAQLLITSTAGTQASIYLLAKTDQGRKAINDPASRIAYFEWSADLDADPYDPAVWAACMPALSFTQDIETIRHAAETLPEGEFRRAFLNQQTEQDERAIPQNAWLACCNPKTAPVAPLTFAIDTALDRSASSIAVCDTQGRVELVENRAGTSWVVDRCLELVRRHKAGLVVDGYSPAAALIDRLKNGGLDVTTYTLKDVGMACNVLYDAILDKQISVRSHTRLDEAVALAKRKPVGQTWLWARTNGDADLTPLYAMTLAYHNATNRQQTSKPRSKIY
jgi:hypothetical protein